MKNAALLSVFLAYMLAATGAPAQEKRYDRPTIIEARVSVRGGLLTSDVISSGLFSERVTGTIQSGLPAVVELFYRLVTREHDTKSRGLRVYELRYDIWKDQYSVQDDDTTLHFPSFETMAHAVEHQHKVALIPIVNVDRGEEYAVEFSIAVHPLRSREKSRIAGWVGEQVRGDGDASWHESVLNLNDLISHFFSRNADGEDRSKWFRTDFFNPGRLGIQSGEAP